jgi:hypothetical protein
MSRPRRAKSAPETTSDQMDALAHPHDSGSSSGGEGQSVAFRLEKLSDPIDQLLVDAQDAQSTWRILRPLGEQAINLLRNELENAAAEGEMDLGAAQKLLTTISQAAKAFASAAQTIHSSFERMVELQRTLGGGQRDLSRLSEADLRKIVMGTAHMLERSLAPKSQITVETTAEEVPCSSS